MSHYTQTTDYFLLLVWENTTKIGMNGKKSPDFIQSYYRNTEIRIKKFWR
jgi:hypothetical protein